MRGCIYPSVTRTHPQLCVQIQRKAIHSFLGYALENGADERRDRLGDRLDSTVVTSEGKKIKNK